MDNFEIEENRISLFNGMHEEKTYTKTYNQFIEQYFKNNGTIMILWNLLVTDGTYTKPINKFYTRYACDLEWAKITKYCTTTEKKIYDTTCLSIFGTSTGNSQVGCPIYKTKDGEYTFCNNGRGAKIGGQIKYWSCKDGKVFFDGKELFPLETKKATTEKLKPKTVEIPKELDGNSDGKGDSEGVKYFQDWLDKNRPGWAEGYTDGKVNKGKGYGRFGRRTRKAWNNYQTDFKNYIGTRTEVTPADELEKNTKITNPMASNESVLKNTIRKNIMETKETKKSLLVEESIIKNRFGLIIESAKSHNNIEIAFLEVMVEMIKLREMGLSEKALIKEESSFFSLLGGMFGGSGAKQNLMGTLRGTFTEYAAKFLLSKLGIDSRSALGKLFVTTLGNVESFSDIPKLFSDCRYISELLSKSVVESILGSIGDKYVAGGLLADAVRNSLTDMLYNQTFMKKIQSAISDGVCSILGDLKGKMSDKAKEMKTKALS